MLINVPDTWQQYEYEGAPVVALLPDYFLPVAVVAANGEPAVVIHFGGLDGAVQVCLPLEQFKEFMAQCQSVVIGGGHRA
jgi:hypothetical protein